MPKAFTENEKKRIRERLMEQGYIQFSTYGLRKTRVDELAAAAGISKAAFYLFHESKEALFMDVVEQAEERFRVEVMATIEQPGPTPRARLVAVLKRAFTLWKTIPILQFFTRNEYDLLVDRVPPEKIQEHMESDRRFAGELVTRCQQAGIPIQAPVEQIAGLMYALFLAILHEDDFGPDTFAPTIDLLIELVAAYCLGEVAVPSEMTEQALAEINKEKHL